MKMTISTNHLQTLLTVMRTGSFSSAAAELGYAPSNVTAQIVALEQQLGVSLFTRSARSIKPTAEAYLLSKEASRVLTDVNVMLVKSRFARRPERRTLKLGIFPSLAAQVLPRVLRDPRWDDIGVDLQISVAEPWDTVEQIRSGSGLDLAFVFQVGESGVSWPSTIVREHVATDPFVVLVPQTWGAAEGEKMELAELATKPWILQFPGGSDGLVIEQHMRNLKFQPRVAAVCDDLFATPDLVAAGIGAALVPELSIARSKGCVRVEVPELELTRHVLALTNRLRETEGSSAVIELFKEAAQA